MHPLDGPREKLGRALEHLNTLRTEADRFLALKPYRLVREVNAERTHYIWRAKIDRPAPMRIGVVVGDVAHNLRSCLDHLAWQLALKHTSRPRAKTAFPIHARPDPFTQSLNERGRQMICDLPEEAQKIVEAIQPYRGNDTGRNLLALNKISNTDKHQVVLLPYARFVGATISGLRSGKPIEQRLITAKPNPACHDGDEFIRIAISAFNDVEEEHEIEYPIFDIAIDTGDNRWLTATNLLHGIHKTISDGVLPKFEAFFTNSGP